MANLKLTEEQQKELLFLTKTKKSNASTVKRAKLLLRLGEGKPLQEAAAPLGYSAHYAQRVLNGYLRQGAQFIKLKKIKKPLDSDKGRLKKTQRQQIIHALQSTTPRALGIGEHDYWTLVLIEEYLSRYFAIHYKSPQPIYALIKAAKLKFYRSENAYIQPHQEAELVYK